MAAQKLSLCVLISESRPRFIITWRRPVFSLPQIHSPCPRFFSAEPKFIPKILTARAHDIKYSVPASASESQRGCLIPLEDSWMKYHQRTIWKTAVRVQSKQLQCELRTHWDSFWQASLDWWEALGPPCHLGREGGNSAWAEISLRSTIWGTERVKLRSKVCVQCAQGPRLTPHTKIVWKT